MKRDKCKSEEQAPEVSPPPSDPNGIDFLVVARVGVGLLCLIIAAWVILKFFLHIF